MVHSRSTTRKKTVTFGHGVNERPRERRRRRKAIQDSRRQTPRWWCFDVLSYAGHRMYLYHTLSQFPSIGLISILPLLFSCRPHLQVSNLRRDPNYSFYYNNCLRLLILNIIPFVLLVFFNTKIYQDIQVRRRGRKGDLMSVCFGSAWLLPLHGGGGGGEGFSIPTNPLLSYTLLRSPFPTAVQTFPLLHVAQISLAHLPSLTVAHVCKLQYMWMWATRKDGKGSY